MQDDKSDQTVENDSASKRNFDESHRAAVIWVTISLVCAALLAITSGSEYVEHCSNRGLFCGTGTKGVGAALTMKTAVGAGFSSVLACVGWFHTREETRRFSFCRIGVAITFSSVLFVYLFVTGRFDFVMN